MGASLLDPKLLAKLGTTQLRARTVVEGLLSGLHRSPHQGQSVEFAEHKEYAPGDELRHLDWKAYGKVDRYYVKQFEHETNLRAFLVVDASASMAYRGGGGLSKLEYASTLAASLAYLLVRQQDAVGLVVAAGKEARYLPPRAALGHFPAILSRLEGLEGKGTTDLAAAAEWVAERARRRAAILFFSDLLDFQPGAVERIADLRRMKNEVTVFHLLDPHELEFPFEDATRFEGMEGEEALEVDPRSIRDSYLEEMERFRDRVRTACRGADVEYELVRTDAPMDRALLRWLGKRES
ncbi:DUF58 domain-containing protein [Vulgatibacter incomptus]|uniref:DUF58 domain-containing protein n=1 Tax=Vulgatibacter incomptus TaxID=1391653 RepID=A0A0K1PHT4_9BACT|nr:DUF58 domain-containing protein [Vulgatibacter incomptus]AKU93085.1 hypothetical protein AKJ08_3472 [Vulgatibacter incomptus]